MAMNNFTYLAGAGKPNSATTVQKTLKDETTTVFAKILVTGSAGEAQVVQTDGASKGWTAFAYNYDVGADTGSYQLFTDAAGIKQWLGAPSIQVVPSGSSDLFVASITGLEASQDVGGGKKQSGIAFTIHKVSGSTSSDPENPPSGSLILVTANYTTSPVF